MVEKKSCCVKEETSTLRMWGIGTFTTMLASLFMFTLVYTEGAESGIAGQLLATLTFCTVIASFVISILLVKNENKKGFSITALVISSMFLLLILVGAMAA